MGRKARLDIYIYADDVYLIASNEHDLQRSFRRISECISEYGMKVSEIACRHGLRTRDAGACHTRLRSRSAVVCLAISRGEHTICCPLVTNQWALISRVISQVYTECRQY